MLATLGKPPTRYTDFAVEAKYDGQRGMAVVDGGTVKLWSRNGADITCTFPEIATALATGNRRMVLDGEIVALDDTGAPSFSRLQRRWPQNRRPTAELLQNVPVRFYVFDILEADGRDLTRKPYTTRRRQLEDLADRYTRIVRVPANWTDTDPATVLEASAELGLEGIVCKHLDSTYTPGVRSRDWIKTCHRQRSSFVIGGWLPGMGVNRNTVGAVIVGEHTEGGQLRFCGVVGAGLGTVERQRLIRALEPLQRNTSPFVNIPSEITPQARWVYAELVGDVEFREFRGTLRHPSWKGIRTDVAPESLQSGVSVETRYSHGAPRK
jgi:bifunctional non-homologous end joining protein LigD